MNYTILFQRDYNKRKCKKKRNNILHPCKSIKMKISLITGHKADYLIRKETPELKKGFKVFLTLAAIGSFIGFILAYFCKSSTKQDMESLENEETDFTEDFSLDGDLKPVSDRGYVSLTKETQEGN